MTPDPFVSVSDLNQLLATLEAAPDPVTGKAFVEALTALVEEAEALFLLLSPAAKTMRFAQTPLNLPTSLLRELVDANREDYEGLVFDLSRAVAFEEAKASGALDRLTAMSTEELSDYLSAEELSGFPPRKVD